MSYPYTGIQGYFEKGVSGTTGIFTKERRIGVGVTGPQAAIHVRGEDGIQAFISENGGISVNTPRDFNTLFNKVGGNNWNYFQFRKDGSAKWAFGVDSNEGFFLGNYNPSFDPAVIIAINRTFINLRYNLLAPSATFTGNINCAGVITAAGFTGPNLNFGSGGTGSTGATGIQGLPGINGATGPAGAGERGATGFPGPQGNTGLTGETGVSLPGFTGLQGPTGAQGPEGIQGITGLRGFNGSQGVTGNQGVPGPFGPTGAQGIRGDTGIQGLRGFTGVQGLTGLKGDEGVTGLQGIPGNQGLTGAQGLSGENGIQGVTGLEGPQGITGVGAIYSRQSFTLETDTLQSGQVALVSINAAKGYVLYRIQTSVSCWVRVYTSTETRDADLERSEGTDPLPGTGVIAEVITTGPQNIPLTPSTIGFTEDGTNNIPLAITNKSVNPASIEITLTLLRIEL
jgi:hypothetical protein